MNLVPTSQAASMMMLPDSGEGAPSIPVERSMNLRYNRSLGVYMLLVICGSIIAAGCDKDYSIIGVGSPGPGYLEVFLSPDNADTVLVIAGDTVTVAEGGQDSLALAVSHGYAFKGIDFAALYKNLSDYLQKTEMYNPIQKSGGAYQPMRIFYTYLPPANYDSLRFSMTADYLQIGYYQIPLTPVEGASDFVVFTQGFHVDEGKTTVITLHFKPLGSLARVGDSYQYSWIFDSVEITYQ
jgi:hypothetical protein